MQWSKRGEKETNTLKAARKVVLECAVKLFGLLLSTLLLYDVSSLRYSMILTAYILRIVRRCQSIFGYKTKIRWEYQHTVGTIINGRQKSSPFCSSNVKNLLFFSPNSVSPNGVLVYCISTLRMRSTSILIRTKCVCLLQYMSSKPAVYFWDLY